ncbi:MAG: type II toxin-antitoxin system PemK/MazF family toxin [Chitinophagaceae bacterium]
MKQGEIWLINLDPTIGAEIRKTRPAIVVNDDSLGKLPLKVIVPLTDWKDRYYVAPWMVRIESDAVNGLTKISGADCFQIRCLSEKRFVKYLGNINNYQLDKIKVSLAKVLMIT